MAAASKNSSTLTRESILDAAIRLFQSHGFNGLGMRQIADNLNIKAPSLYHHFPSKEVLAQQALLQYRENQMIRLRLIEEKVLLADRLYGYVELFAEMLSDGRRPCMYLAMMNESTYKEDFCAEELKLFAKQNIDWLENVLREAQYGANSRAAISERNMAEIIFSSLEGVTVISLADENPSEAFRERAANFLKLVIGVAESP
ncbi:TetR/AcrR family transcriptional regulator [Janthinobacterium fluminis]|uniref:TetR/AcrR family transcriptional regulator n=1 Tax=Janthinobacterium fluminis TaxID=2987524 RepID=A0ABT5K6B7_9BURK|nr:TetR/AcrR family transcriptional regulator [Janthinobacterium fluminis]MDC8760547.1 TetR/AcrR family transcriptional regulator [Janthinobacterium fluminis]